jgi:hypothetical protein
VLTSLCMYRVKAGSEAAFRQLLSKHWPTLRNVGLAADEPPVTYEGIEKPGAPLFVELLTWKDEEGPNIAHELPEVMAVWEPMGKLCESREGRPPMEFPNVNRIQVPYQG